MLRLKIDQVGVELRSNVVIRCKLQKPPWFLYCGVSYIFDDDVVHGRLWFVRAVVAVGVWSKIGIVPSLDATICNIVDTDRQCYSSHGDCHCLGFRRKASRN